MSNEEKRETIPDLTEAQCQAMTHEQLRPYYKAACRESVRVNAQVELTRKVLHAKQEILTAEQRLAETKGKHASNAGKGGGL